MLASLKVQSLDNATMSQLNIPAKTAGVVVSAVEPGGPAEAAGIQRGDVIQEVNHEVVKNLDEYQKAAHKIKKRTGRSAAQPAREQPVRGGQSEVIAEVIGGARGMPARCDSAGERSAERFQSVAARFCL